MEFPRYTVQVHGEWSQLPGYEWMDIDFELETWDEVQKVIDTELPKGMIYIIYDEDRLVGEYVK